MVGMSLVCCACDFSQDGIWKWFGRFLAETTTTFAHLSHMRDRRVFQTRLENL